jgi:hypothetical protein
MLPGGTGHGDSNAGTVPGRVARIMETRGPVCV